MAKKIQQATGTIDMFQTEKKQQSHTEEQGKFINYTGPESIVLSATAGSGKSYSCVERMKCLLERGVAPDRIIFFSFTNAATKELQRRIGREDVEIRTIHSFCGKVLTRLKKGKAIVSFFDFINWYKNKNKPSKFSPKEDVDEFNEIISNMYEDSSMYDAQIAAFKLQSADKIKCRVPEFWQSYREFLMETKSRDFSDMIIEVRDLFKEDRYLSIFKNKYDYVFVDEYQDTSSIQMQILLALNAKHYYLVGDKNQSLYMYSGASCDKVEAMVRARRKTVDMNLTINFRSDKAIVENSNKHSSLVAVPNSVNDGYINNRIIYTIDGLIDVLTGQGEVAVLARTNGVIKSLELELMKRHIPLRYFNYITKSDIDSYHKDTMSVPTRNRFETVKPYFNGSIPSFLAFLKSCEESKKFITSIHKSKGLEFETCIVVNSVSYEILEENGILEQLSSKQLSKISYDPSDEDDIESKNVHYVAISRSKHKLFYMVFDF